MNECYAVLLDTVSIQNYIFRSNKLKENLGASFLVDQIYDTYLAEALSKITGRIVKEELQHLGDWKNSDATAPECKNGVEIGYIGGGNALLFFQEERQARGFIEVWTNILLIRAPGLTTAVALGKFSNEPEQFKSELNTLFKLLKKNKNRHAPITSLPRHGITAECARSELSAEIYNSDIKDYVSADVNARIEAAHRSKKTIEQQYRTLVGDNYCFSDELDALGGIRGEDSHIAVVHIDGNDVGKFFKEADSLKTIRTLSKKIHDATLSAFQEIIRVTVSRYNEIMASLGFGQVNPVPKENGKNVLPLRPIILGGDDVTIVCDARLGIYFAIIFINEFEKTKVNGKKLTACAGVSIVKTKYPFYRAYWLAEELCANAKTRRKNMDDSASFLDFHVSLGGVAGSLKYIRQRYFGIDPRENNNEKASEYLLYRPLKVVPKEPFDELGLDMMLEKAWHLKKYFPKNKLADLRAVLNRSKDARLEFVKSLEYRDHKLPDIEGYQYKRELFENNLTPYFDMLELLRFYPEFALQEFGENHE